MAEDDIWQALAEVYDPELGLNIVDLGLVYGVHRDDGGVRVQMTLTALGCPLGATIEGEVRAALRRIPCVRDAAVEVVWDPPWGPERISVAGRRALGLDES